MLKIENDIFSISSDAEFERMAMEIFRYQRAHNSVYGEWCGYMLTKGEPECATEIPFLPIEFFKTREVITGLSGENTIRFLSSGTTGSVPSVHYVTDPALYERSYLQGFMDVYGDPAAYCILALLPHYTERGNSSLVYMVRDLVQRSGHSLSGFYRGDEAKLTSAIENLKASGEKVLLLGVSYALLDLCETGMKLTSNFIVMETGGMKGRRREMTRPELSAHLAAALGVGKIHSEYGMTELLSQAYNTGDGLFRSPPWMRFLIRDRDDPRHLRTDGKTGGVNVIDLANIYSCAFIATSDLGRLHDDGGLELMGRYDHSDVRGCNLMLDNL
jgi:hypothetical protein